MNHLRHDANNDPTSQELSDLSERIDAAKREMDQILRDRKAQIDETDSNRAAAQGHQIDAKMAQIVASNKALVEHIRILKTKYQHDQGTFKIIENEGIRFMKLTQDHRRGEHEVQKPFQSAAMSTRRGQAQSALSNAKDRQEQIDKISQQMEVLLNLFQDMNTLVQEQDVAVQQIEQKTYQAQEDVNQGVVELDQGIVKAKSARRKKWWCLLIVVILIVIIVIVVMVVVVKPIIEESNNKKRSLEYLNLARRSILEGSSSPLLGRSIPPQARRALLG
ncbi:hypothetical protein BJ508DRAFT_137632 [Ascobolus immersus RN42]|uniref:t-SNARE coiled-coil homology domain-containing protein n=1 Tax=Ascobolus immersus RN42 TaxID=1160509 RepID=A0A3N4I6H4_ASCIM|nr:hypothetical protein BJ508DRAFT_137632 [Ascobolus immersus RN42]